MYMTTVQDKLL